MKDKYPSDYQEIFNLILSLKENTNQKELENYFSRLTKGTLGEFEFLKRMAFENIPVTRIDAQPILWEKYEFCSPPDFIINLKNNVCCVEVKNYNKYHLIKYLKIEIHSLDNCINFKKQFNLDKALIAIKRFEKWYLFDAMCFKEKAMKSKENYIIPIKDIAKESLLNEEQYVFNLGDEKEEGVFFKKLLYEIEHNKDELNVFIGNKIKTKKIIYTSIKKEIIKSLAFIINNNLKDIISNAYNLDEIKLIEDILPTKFSIINKLEPYKKEDVNKFFNSLVNEKIIKYKNFEKDFKRIANINWYNYIKEFEKNNIKFKDMKEIIKKITIFKKVLKKDFK